MIDLFEKTLERGGDLEKAKSTLLNEANIDRVNRCNQIEHDYKVAYLIRECLLMEPRGTCGYAVAKGIMNRLHEKYRDKPTEKVIRKLVKEMKKEVASNDDNRATEENHGCTAE